LADYIKFKQPVCVVAPVDYALTNESLLQVYQQLDLWSLQAVTMGSYGLNNLLLSNGANFAYQKIVFTAVRGFEGNLHIASGDDMFLLEKFKASFPTDIGYLKSSNAIVTTSPVLSWRNLISQRIRWASKTTQQKSTTTKWVGLVVVANSFILLLIPFLCIFKHDHTQAFLVMFGIKMVVDYLFIQGSAKFFGKQIPRYFILSFYINAWVTVTVFLLSIVGKYTWKQRTFKH
ncbi:MAG: glycosyl transferase, partial [Marinirhabdus sp.]|nr:glycosyl transferase [Marinirhabdus sp.]